MRPGYKSTEFWMSLAAVLVGAVVASGILDETASDLDNRIVGLIVTVLAALGYTATRGIVKANAAKTEAVRAVMHKPDQDPT